MEFAADGRVWGSGLDLEDADFRVGVVERGEDLVVVVPGDFFGHVALFNSLFVKDWILNIVKTLKRIGVDGLFEAVDPPIK